MEYKGTKTQLLKRIEELEQKISDKESARQMEALTALFREFQINNCFCAPISKRANREFNIYYSEIGNTLFAIVEEWIENKKKTQE